MSLPFFYIASYSPQQQRVVLDEENSKHAIQVLRLSNDSRVMLTDGQGHCLEAVITRDHRKACELLVESVRFVPPPTREVTLAVSLLKNRSRLEWLLEKVTEMGVTRIVPLRCERTEKETIRNDRLQSVLISALLQSRQCRLPALLPPQSFASLASWKINDGANYIAYCGAGTKIPLVTAIGGLSGSALICIGPEGDFTPPEHEQALAAGFTSVSLGNTRLRTETAALVATSLLCQQLMQ